MEKDVDYYRKDARNIVWAVAFVAFLPTFVLLVMMFSGSDIKWDVVTFGILGYSLVVACLAFVAGIQCAKGKKAGRTLAFIPTVLVLLNFPIGTIFGISALVKLNKAEFLNTLE
jgi:hypothetical protein